MESIRIRIGRTCQNTGKNRGWWRLVVVQKLSELRRALLLSFGFARDDRIAEGIWRQECDAAILVVIAGLAAGTKKSFRAGTLVIERPRHRTVRGGSGIKI